MSGSYTIAFLGLWALLALLFVQWFVASMVKAREPSSVPGKISRDLSHESFVFRAHRTFMNSLENMPLILGTFSWQYSPVLMLCLQLHAYGWFSLLG